MIPKCYIFERFQRKLWSERLNDWTKDSAQATLYQHQKGAQDAIIVMAEKQLVGFTDYGLTAMAATESEVGILKQAGEIL